MPEAKQKNAYSAVRKTGKLPVHGAEDLARALEVFSLPADLYFYACLQVTSRQYNYIHAIGKT